MNRLRAAWVLLTFLTITAGCHGQRADPFGRATIPPPGTGAVAQPGGALVGPTYYPPAGVGAQAPVVTPGVAAAPPPTLYGSPPPIGGPAMPGAPGAFGSPPAGYSAGAAMPALQPPPTWAPPGGAPGTLTPAPATGPTPFNPAAPAPGAVPAAPAVPRVIAPSPPWSGSAMQNISPASNGAVSAASWNGLGTTSSTRLQPPDFSVLKPAPRPAAAVPVPPAASAAAPTPANPNQVVVIDNSAAGEPVIRVAESPQAAAELLAKSTPPTIDLASLPTTGSGNRPTPPSASVGVPSVAPAGAIAPVSFTQLQPQPAAATFRLAAAIASAPSNTADHYGHAADYKWLKGKLEYSAGRQQWKLRYIPVDTTDGRTDENGGSVILKTTPELQKYHDGEFVNVDGTLGNRDPNAKDFAPSYEIRQIQHIE
ncbi:MAG: hypothetical protein K8T25_04600 [Planctomycetia bacterium]|nr:hypothetical protein [Planctomycetia bacterium]